MLIPDNLVEIESFGERILYLKFKNDGSTGKMYVLHSVFTNYHFKNISGELDFLILSPNEGIFAIEVKHGGVSRKDGTWSFTNRRGEVTKRNKSPFAQVDGTMNSIRSFILDKIKHNKKLYGRLSKVLWGTGVAFTSMDEFVDFGTEGYSWQVLTKQGLNLPIGHYISSLSKGWHNQNKGKYWYDVNESRPSAEDCKIILQILRGDFDIEYSKINRINESQYLIEQYTKEQFGLLDFVNYNDRCLIEGAAGTGKTLMALEIAQRKIKDNYRVGLFCYNNLLGLKLKRSIELITEDKTDRSYTGTLHSFLSLNTTSVVPGAELEKQKHFSEDLPFEFLYQNEDLSESEKFDILIIDEAQDLISPYYIEVLDAILKGGIKDGQWILFGDFTNQAIYLNKPEEILKLLNSRTNFTRFPPLKINCRNTRRIASQNTLITGVNIPQFTSRTLEGNIVACKFPARNSEAKAIEEIISDLLKKEIPLEKITLLSPKHFDRSLLRNSEFIAKWVELGLQVSTIHSYKGLENTIIVLYDFDEISSDKAQGLLYVGISRSRQELYIVLNKTQEQTFSNLIKLNYIKLN